MAKIILGKALGKYANRHPWLQRSAWWVEGTVLRLSWWLVSLLPVDTASRIGWQLLSRIGPHLEKSRHFRRNFSLMFPEASAREIDDLVRKAWGNFGSVLMEYPHLGEIVRPGPDARVETVFDTDIGAFRGQGKGAVFVTAHIANWELTAGVAAGLGIPFSAVYRRLRNPIADRLLYRQRRSLGFDLIERDVSARQLVRKLVKGESVGLVTDQRVDSGEPVPFFGMEMQTSTAPARLALRFGVPLIPVRVERLQGARFRLTVCAPVEPGDEALSDDEKALGMTAKVNALFEDWIRAHPEQCYCAKRRWPKQAGPDHLPARDKT